MSDCPTHGPLLGGYVLGALDPDEMEEMRRHLAGCPHCGPEARRLEALPGLLDRIVPADVPPPSLSPQLEEAVLDRFARER
ncbi:MAG: anti-sigma factor family protein, partial [Thermoleophilaceae bacterium]